jgi:hypothetical protein
LRWIGAEARSGYTRPTEVTMNDADWMKKLRKNPRGGCAFAMGMLLLGLGSLLA